MSQVGLGLLLLFAASTLLDGLLRATLGQPVDLVRDIGGVVVAISISLCFPQAFLEQHNIAINFIDGYLSGQGNRVLSLVAALGVKVVVVLFAWQFFVFAGKSARAHEVSVAYNIPLAPFWYVVDACFWLVVLVQTVVVLDSVIALWTSDSKNFLRPEAGVL